MDGDRLEFDDEQYDDAWSSEDAGPPVLAGDKTPAWRRIDELREQRELKSLLKEFYDD
jgi:hypothetical protein